MSRARRSRSSPVQLFPFLAVLVSTMGALILLLLAINRQVSQRAIAAAVESLLEHVGAKQASLDRRRVDLRNQIKNQTNRLATARTAQHAVERELVSRDGQVREAAGQLASLRNRLDQLTAERNETAVKIQTLREEIVAINAAATDWASRTHDPDRTFVPVVHPGKNGTNRKPIYLECSSLGITFQPEGKVVSATSLQREGGVETLARAVHALAAHYADAGEKQSAAPSEPYPLMLVRPDGVLAFHTARRVIEQLGIAFGYELIEAGWTLEYPEPDPQVVALLDAALVPRGNAAALPGGTGNSNAGNDRPRGYRGTGSLSPNLGSILGLEPEQSRSTRDGSGSTLDREPSSARGEFDSDSTLIGNANSAVTAGSNAQGESQTATVGQDNTVQENAHNSTAVANTSNSTKTSETAEHCQEVASSDPTPILSRRFDAVASTGSDSSYDDEFPVFAQPVSGKISVPRTIEVECWGDGIRIRTNQQFVAISKPSVFHEALGRLAEAIEEEMVRWGPPGMTFRWQPKLYCLVHFDGLEIFHGLRQSLVGTGIEVNHVIVAADPWEWDASMFLYPLAQSLFSPGARE